jgi:hypothetical protein
LPRNLPNLGWIWSIYISSDRHTTNNRNRLWPLKRLMGATGWGTHPTPGCGPCEGGEACGGAGQAGQGTPFQPACPATSAPLPKVGTCPPTQYSSGSHLNRSPSDNTRGATENPRSSCSLGGFSPTAAASATSATPENPVRRSASHTPWDGSTQVPTA